MFRRCIEWVVREGDLIDLQLSEIIKWGSLIRECLLLIVTTKEWTTGKTTKSRCKKIVKDMKRATRKRFSSEETIRIVLEGLHSEDSIAELCRGEGISQGIYLN